MTNNGRIRELEERRNEGWRNGGAEKWRKIGANE